MSQQQIFLSQSHKTLFLCPYDQSHATKTLETKSVEIFKQLFFKMAAINKNIMVAFAALLLDEEEQTRKKRQTNRLDNCLDAAQKY